MRRVGKGSVVLLLAQGLIGCGDPINLGNHLIWSTDHEVGDLDEWQGPEGGAGPQGVGELSQEQARSGSYSLKLTNSADADAAVGAGFEFNGQREAYFSAWFYVPQVHQTDFAWSIMRFLSVGEDCVGPDGLCPGVDVSLRPLPNGDAVLYLFNDEAEVLQAPLSEPPVYIPLQRWFHIEVFFRRTTDASGHVWLWFDGAPLYRFENWRTVDYDNLFWSVSNTAIPRDGGTSVIYVDDAAISTVPVTPDGELRAP